MGGKEVLINAKGNKRRIWRLRLVIVIFEWDNQVDRKHKTGQELLKITISITCVIFTVFTTVTTGA